MIEHNSCEITYNPEDNSLSCGKWSIIRRWRQGGYIETTLFRDGVEIWEGAFGGEGDLHALLDFIMSEWERTGMVMSTGQLGEMYHD